MFSLKYTNRQYIVKDGREQRTFGTLMEALEYIYTERRRRARASV